MLVSPNNRRLGQSARGWPNYDTCRDWVSRLRERHDELKPVTTTAESNGHWAWRIELDGVVAAVATRTYLRMQECDYNLRCFLEGVPLAELSPTVRTVRIGRLQPLNGAR
ncbi:MAG TPA: hypothetical protein VJT31_32440 [Rugosimonospora sp.]|nr:hypothetical protein [Rugosimonospora sp.]